MVIEFYEKPGCAGNARQKAKLSSLGCMLSVKSLLDGVWDKKELREYFADKPVSAWFNMSAPKIKDGLIDVNALSENEALEMMVKEPLLIKRPLMKCGNVKISGFDPKEIQEKLGLNVEEAPPTCTAHDNCNKN
jgi:nitrogenase-associated protein